jgi:hypothetical protein
VILTPHYLFVHIPGRGQITLSLPGGFERAFRYDRLPEDALLWHSAGSVWLPILRHPAIVRLREAALSEAYDYDFEFAPREPLEQNEPELPLPVEPAAVESDHPELLPLIKVSDWKTHLAEFSRLVARSSAQEERRRSSRLSVGIRPRETGPVFFAGVAAPVMDPLEVEPRTLARFRTRLLAGAFLLFLAMGIGGWLWYRTPSATLAIEPTRTHVLSARERDSLARASSGSNAQIAAASPLADLEAELESDLRIADAVIWQPAIDFASEDQVVRSTRKLDAVRNSIGLYRLGAWRIADSLARETDPRLEPFGEADRVDAVVKAMDAAVTFLHSVVGHFRVSGDLLVFERGEDAEHYNTIARMADSLVRAPVELDSFPAIRPPRRVVTRLLATLPSAVAPSPSKP